MNRSAMHWSILAALSGAHYPQPTFVCLVDGDGDGDVGGGDGGGGDGSEGDGDGDDPAPTFTQTDVDRIVQRRLRKQTAENKKLSTKIESLTAQVEEFQAKLEGGDKDEDTKTNRELEKLKAQVQSLTESNGTLEGQAKQARTKLHSHVRDSRVRDVLLAAGADPKRIRQAAKLFVDEASVEVEELESGEIVIAGKVGSKPFEDDLQSNELLDATKLWLKDNSHFARGPGSGGGTPYPGGPGSNGRTNFDVDKDSSQSLIRSGVDRLTKR